MSSGAQRRNVSWPRTPTTSLVYGHTHRQLITRAGDRLVINPGAAGPRRFKLMPSVGRLVIEGGRAEAELVTLLM